MAFGGQHVLGFSPEGKFALINDQGVLRIWDTDTNELKQEYTPNLHLAGPCSALVWLTASSPSTTKDKKVSKQHMFLTLLSIKTSFSLRSKRLRELVNARRPFILHWGLLKDRFLCIHMQREM